MKNLKFTFRMLKRNPLLVFVAIPGLALGLAAVLLLTVYLKHELSFDRHFATKDRVLRLYNVVDEASSRREVYGNCLRKAYTEIPAKIPEIESATQLYRGWEVHVKNAGKQFPPMNLIYADPGFFDVFGLNLLTGRKKDALSGERNVILSKSSALQIFNNLDCVGQNVTISDEQFTVTGVMNDLPETTHFNFDLLASIETIHPEQLGGCEFLTYFLIRDRENVKRTGEQIVVQNNELMKPWGKKLGWTVKSGTELLNNIHFDTPVKDDFPSKASLTNIIIVVGIAIFILLIAIVNYVTLYLLHGEKRMAEFASRKASGATQRDCSRIIYTETGLMASFAFLMAVGIALAVQPHFARLMQRSLSVSDILSPIGLLLILGILLLLIVVSGAYPAFHLSRINLVFGLKGNTGPTGRKSKMSVASVLVLFSVTVFLITSLVIIRAQVKHLKDIPLGFQPEQVIGISGYTSEIGTKYTSIEEELSRLPFIETNGFSDHPMGKGGSGQNIRVFGRSDGAHFINEYRVQPGFAETMKFELLDGRFFLEKKSDRRSILLNEAAVKMLGLDHPVGVQVQMDRDTMTVIGVVKDFYYAVRPGDAIEPLVMDCYRDGAKFSYMRVTGGFTSERQGQVSAILKRFDPNGMFDYFHLSDMYSAAFKEEDRVMSIVTLGTWLAILISFVGLMALSLMQVNRRTKEIGIRKVSGSTVPEVMGRLLKQSVLLVVCSCLIAFIPGYYTMNLWLSHFPEKIPLHAGYFLLSGFLALLISLLAVSWQSWKAATRNPVESLRYE